MNNIRTMLWDEAISFQPQFPIKSLKDMNHLEKGELIIRMWIWSTQKQLINKKLQSTDERMGPCHFVERLFIDIHFDISVDIYLVGGVFMMAKDT